MLRAIPCSFLLPKLSWPYRFFWVFCDRFAGAEAVCAYRIPKVWCPGRLIPFAVCLLFFPEWVILNYRAPLSTTEQ